MERPLILAFDTSGPYCAAALLAGQRVIGQVAVEMKKGQAERLMFLLEDLLGQNALGYQDLDALGVGTGPGNFTGIRIGVAAARGLALGLGIPAYGVNGFEQRAVLAPEQEVQIIPAPRDQRYVHRAGKTGMLSVQECEEAGYGAPALIESDRLAVCIAQVARSRWPETVPAPSPFYVRAPDAAPPKDAAPRILL